MWVNSEIYWNDATVFPRDYFDSVLKKVRSTWPAFWQLKLPTDASVFTISHSPFLTYGLCVLCGCRCVGVGVCACVGVCESATESLNVSMSQCLSKWWHCSDMKHQYSHIDADRQLLMRQIHKLTASNTDCVEISTLAYNIAIVALFLKGSTVLTFSVLNTIGTIIYPTQTKL